MGTFCGKVYFGQRQLFANQVLRPFPADNVVKDRCKEAALQVPDFSTSDSRERQGGAGIYAFGPRDGGRSARVEQAFMPAESLHKKSA